MDIKYAELKKDGYNKIQAMQGIHGLPETVTTRTGEIEIEIERKFKDLTKKGSKKLRQQRLRFAHHGNCFSHMICLLHAECISRKLASECMCERERDRETDVLSAGSFLT